MATSTLRGLAAHGQSIWLDYIQRALLTGGGFRHLVEADGVSGVTSNPAILEKAIVEHRDYDAAIRSQSGLDPRALYEHLAIEDLQMAADLLRPVHDASRGRDGYVSFEVSPHLAYDTEATVREAGRLWRALDRPNSLIKVPATAPGVAAIRQLIAEGINVNATLLFSLQRYREVAQAYLAGLEARAAQGRPLSSVASVASFFLSRIDTLVDRRLDALAADVSRERATALRGRTAIASARLAYQAYRELFSGARWQRLAASGAGTQRLLWASTSTKNPAYSDVKYVDALIGAETINTLPMETLDAYRDHGHPAARLEADIEAAHETLAGLAQLGIDLQSLADQLEREGVQKFIDAFDKLLDNLARRTSVPVA